MTSLVIPTPKHEEVLNEVLMADVGDKLGDVGALSALGELAERCQDARGMLQLGKAALARGMFHHGALRLHLLEPWDYPILSAGETIV